MTTNSISLYFIGLFKFSFFFFFFPLESILVVCVFLSEETFELMDFQDLILLLRYKGDKNIFTLYVKALKGLRNLF